MNALPPKADISRTSRNVRFVPCPLFAFGALGIVRGLILPRQFIARWLIISRPISVFRDVEFLVLVVFDASTILIAPAVPFSVETARFLSSNNTARKPVCYVNKMKSPTRAAIHFGFNGKAVQRSRGAATARPVYAQQRTCLQTASTPVERGRQDAAERKSWRTSLLPPPRKFGFQVMSALHR